jgi:hypothetical protein
VAGSVIRMSAGTGTTKFADASTRRKRRFGPKSACRSGPEVEKSVEIHIRDSHVPI